MNWRFKLKMSVDGKKITWFFYLVAATQIILVFLVLLRTIQGFVE